MATISDTKIEVVLRNPLDKEDQISYWIDVYDQPLGHRWIQALRKNLEQDYHLEKNYCFLGFAKSARNLEYLLQNVNITIQQINKFNASGEWQKHGLESYHIDEVFSKEKVVYSPDEAPVGKFADDPRNLGLTLKHEAMNNLHRYFEDLQGEAWNISPYYQLADYETKWAIRQLNDLCHEIESFVLSYRKTITSPLWQRPSQITTFLNAPRYDLQEKDYDLFLKNRYDRELGGVYLHWAQVGKTQFEVFRDEDGEDIDEATCSAINSLKFYSGEFDVEWGRTITEENAPWHKKEQEDFRQWLARNNFDWNNPKLSLGYIKLGEVDLQRSFGTSDFLTILDQLSSHLDIYKINIHGKEINYSKTFDYVWSDAQYKQMQINFLKPGYDWSKRQYGK